MPAERRISGGKPREENRSISLKAPTVDNNQGQDAGADAGFEFLGMVMRPKRMNSAMKPMKVFLCRG